MYRVSSTTQIFTSIAIALSIGGCNSNVTQTSIAQNTTTTADVAASTPADLPIATAQAATVAPVPAVGSLDAIPLLPQTQIAKSSLVTDASVNPQLAKQPQRKRHARNGVSPSISCRAFPCLVLSQDPNNSRNQFNNPIYKLTAYKDNSTNYAFQLDAVTGRAFTQERNRYQSMTEAPLPDGSYVVVPRIVKGTIREVGGTMVPIFPKRGFDSRMRRTALGIHWDPSFDRDKAEDGTSGCIGLTNKSDYHRVRNFVLKYRPRSLEVQIDR
jgi:hypothetical protein